MTALNYEREFKWKDIIIQGEREDSGSRCFGARARARRELLPCLRGRANQGSQSRAVFPAEFISFLAKFHFGYEMEDGQVRADHAWARRLRRAIAEKPLAGSLMAACASLASVAIDIDLLDEILRRQERDWRRQRKLERLGLPESFMNFALAIYVYTLEDPAVYTAVNGAMYNPARRGVQGVLPGLDLVAASSVSSPAAWSWLDDGDRWKPYEGALAASIEAAFGDANRDTLDLHAVSTGAGAAGRHTHIWGSFERNTGTWTPYSATETAAIEDAFARGHLSINLPTCFNATIHFNRFGGHHHQTTPAVGSKPEGYRSVLRGKAGMKATLHHDGSMWRLELPNFHTGYEQQVEICSTYVINFDDMMQYNMSTRRGRPIRREVPANPVVDGTWDWQDTDGSWKAYEPLACGQIALARHVGRQGTLLHDGRSNYLVDLSRSVQINMSTHTERPIRHREATALRLPRDAASTQRSDYVRVAGSGMSAARRLLAAAAGRLLATSSSKISSTDRPDIREADFHMLVSV